MNGITGLPPPERECDDPAHVEAAGDVDAQISAHISLENAQTAFPTSFHTPHPRHVLELISVTEVA